ncbi:sigma factor-like helix-turn-helix DNA-binding protein [Virgibacillus sediminis]|uniref:Sigma factor-like helix-turn-helix DNA-binding protein n=1 Tax=Virgibacillus sediminis TaxID=202260 RepID=A0ABV7A3Q6_9BACI
MQQENNLSKDDAIFFMDMVGSVKSPNFETRMNGVKPYYKIIKERDSNKFRRFIRIYIALRHILSEREQVVLNELYGLIKEGSQLKTVGALLNITPERVRQIRNQAERKIVREVLRVVKVSN